MVQSQSRPNRVQDFGSGSFFVFVSRQRGREPIPLVEKRFQIGRVRVFREQVLVGRDAGLLRSFDVFLTVINEQAESRCDALFVQDRVEVFLEAAIELKS